MKTYKLNIGKSNISFSDLMVNNASSTPTIGDYLKAMGAYTYTAPTPKPTKVVKIKINTTKPKVDNSWKMDYLDTYNMYTGEYTPATYSQYFPTKVNTPYYSISDITNFFNKYKSNVIYDAVGNKIEFFDAFIRISNSVSSKIIPTDAVKISTAANLFATKPQNKTVKINFSFA